MPVANAEVAVLIVGGGPVGLTTRALLERWGVRAMLVEKHGELSPFPRSRLVNVRSMEIYRQLGLAAKITARAFAPEYGRIRFRDTLLGRDFGTAAMVGINAPIPQSPVIGVLSSQALPNEHADLCGLGPHGALLIRPDGHIGARWRDRPPSDSTLHPPPCPHHMAAFHAFRRL